jgi:hypothetical protein
MNIDWINLFIFFAICFVIYLVFRNFKKSTKEGLTTTPTNTATTPAAIGAAGNASTYASNIKSASIALQDQLLISKYQTDYENVILNLDDYINNLMLSTALNINTSNINNTNDFFVLSQLQNSKQALNSVMKFIDSSGL